MPTFFRKPLPPLLPSVLLLVALCAAPAAAQTLARPGWKGSGIAVESWWRNAVFYRIDVPRFQDSDGDGIGDLSGIAQRLDYLQSLGIDAIILSAPADAPGFDDLLRQASASHIRLVVELTAADAPHILATSRSWLARGAAGIYVRSSTLPATANTADILHDLRTLTQSLPGERILITDSQPLSSRSDGPQLVDLQLPAEANDPSPALRSVVTMVTAAPPLPLFSVAPQATPAPEEESIARSKIAAALLLTARSAASLEYGDELGLHNSTGVDSVMQWTPTNVTPPAPAAVTEPAPATAAQTPTSPPKPGVYGAFVPYKPAARPVVKTEAQLAEEAIAALPGFSTRALADGHTSSLNAATENTQPGSLLNFYRRLIQLHHDNSSLRTGSPYVLDSGAEHTFILLRRAPAGARTAATVLVVCNFAAQSVTLSLDAPLGRLHMHSGSLRPLLASWTANAPSQPSGHIVLPPFGVYLAELYH